MAGEDPKYLVLVRELPCLAAELDGPDCGGAIQAHHAGRRPGVALKAHDHSAIPLCSIHHTSFHQLSPPFRMPRARLRAWQDRAILATQVVLGCTPETSTGAVQGAAHYAWKGDSARVTTKRERAQRRYKLGACQGCGSKQATDRHHVDGNTGNNKRSNVRLLCRRCHMLEDGRLATLAALPKPRKMPPRPCRICGRLALANKLNRGRCRRCAEYWRRNGTDRPWGDQNGQRVREQEAWQTLCLDCGRPPTALKTAPIRGLCTTCYKKRSRRGEFRKVTPRPFEAEDRRDEAAEPAVTP
jgi:hypothetical protein